MSNMKNHIAITFAAIVLIASGALITIMKHSASSKGNDTFDLDYLFSENHEVDTRNLLLTTEKPKRHGKILRAYQWMQVINKGNEKTSWREKLLQSRPSIATSGDDGLAEERGFPKATSLKEDALISPQTSEQTEPYPKNHLYDVIIVGAGWAGVAAAVRLQGQNITNIKILEGRDYIGGRSYTKKHSVWENNDYELDMGSMWLLYGSQNPLWDIANETEVDKVPYPYLTTLASMEENETVGVEEFNDLSYQVYDYGFGQYRVAKTYLVDAVDEGLNVSVSETLDLIDRNSHNDRETKTIVLKASVQEYIELMYGARTEDMSLWYGIQGEASYLGGFDAEDADDHLLYGGFTSMINDLAGPIEDRIQMNAKVTSINYKADTVKIKYDDRSGNNIGMATVHAKKVILTAPQGVLSKTASNGGIRFRPPLPKKTRKAIDRIGMGQMIKMFLFWDETDIFWPGDYEEANQYIDKVSIGSEGRITFYNPSYNRTEKLPYLFTFMLGDEILGVAEQFANSDDTKYKEELTKLAMVRLRNIFGDSIPEPVKVFATKWTEDEFSYGVYSYNKVGYSSNDRRKLRQPIEDKIFLGGEATSTNSYATVHGAYYSGIRAARKAAKSLLAGTDKST